MSDEDLPCRQVVELLTDHLEGALATEDADALERHLATCPGCSTWFDQLRTTVAIASSLRDDGVAAERFDAVVALLRRSRGDRPRS